MYSIQDTTQESKIIFKTPLQKDKALAVSFVSLPGILSLYTVVDRVILIHSITKISAISI